MADTPGGSRQLRPSLLGDRHLAERDPFIDVVRVACICVVVLGHWITTTVVWSDGAVDAVNALEVIAAGRAVTWLVQVMPLVFFIGGFANAVSLCRHGGGYLPYLEARLGRLLWPTYVFLSVWLAVAVGIEIIDPTAPAKAEAAEVAALPLWFLGIYVVAVALAPAAWRLHGRARFTTAAVLGVGVAVVDAVSIGGGLTDVGGLNYALVWLLAHQMGFFYADGTLERWGLRGAALLAGIGMAGLVLLTTVGNYPVSLVGVPGQARSNAQPPSLAMLALTLWLVGLALLLRPCVSRLWSRRRLVGSVKRVHGVVLTTFLWHVTAISVAGAIWHAVGLPEPEIGSVSWWRLRPLWLLMAVVPLVMLLAVFGRLEKHPRGRPGGLSPSRAAALGFAVFAIAIGLLGFGETGFFPVAPAQGEALLMFELNPLQNVFHLVVGTAVVLVARRKVAVPAALAGAGLFVLSGLLEVIGCTVVDSLGMDGFTGGAHIVAGGIAVFALLAALALEQVSAESLRRDRTEPETGDNQAGASRS
jgi:hypothetical protein